MTPANQGWMFPSAGFNSLGSINRSTTPSTYHCRHHQTSNHISHQNPTFISFLNPQVISISGPFPPTQAQNQTQTRTRIHNSDYIDFNDQVLFDQILDRIATSTPQIRRRTAVSFINSLSTSTLSKKHKPKNPDQDLDPCPECREEFRSSSLISKLPCKHLFHYECIMPWLYRSCVCPVCRFELPKEKVSGPLMRYAVKVGNECVEGSGGDRESAFWDAVLKNELNLRVIPSWFLGPIGWGPKWVEVNKVHWAGCDN